MAETDKEGTDGASIKPVSSLRSHFENIAGTSPAPTSHPIRASPRFGAHPRQSERELASPERASLDLPRRPSPWSAPIVVPPKSSQHGVKALGPPVTPRTQRPRSTYIQRPASAEPQSPPRAPPIVTIESPKSPPKSADMPQARPLPLPPSPKPTIDSGLGSRPAPPIPPHSPKYAARPVSKSPIQTPVVGKYDSFGAAPAPASARKANATNDIDTALANAASPFPNTEKPRIPAKPPDGKVRTNLGPDRGESEKRVSPFSTPPSSENSTPRIPNSGLILDSPYSPIVAGLENTVSPFSPAPAPQPISARYRQDPDIANPKPRIAASVPRANRDLEDTAIRRPGLPPRRVTDKGHQQPSTMPRNETRIASMSRVQDTGTPAEAHSATAFPQTTTGNKFSRPEFPPPPKRTGTTDSFDLPKGLGRAPSPPKGIISHANDSTTAVAYTNDPTEAVRSIMDYPDALLSNRRPPRVKQGAHELDTGYETRLFDICGDSICTTGYSTRAWDLASGHPIMSLVPVEQTKVTALAFKPGATADQEGQRIWVGTSYGDMKEIDVPSQSVVTSRTSAHGRREIVRIHRYQNSMWTLDDGGILNVWPPDEAGLPNMQRSPRTHRLPKGHTFSIVIHHRLWVATGKDIRVFEPASTVDIDLQLTLHPLSQPNVGEVTSGAVISNQHDRVYFGHTDGKVTVYSTNNFSCLGVINVSVYKINALAGAGDFLWAGFNTGMIYVYDTRTHPWTTKKDWQAHSHPICGILVDRSSVWKSGMLQVASIGTDNAIRLWDGTLEDDWLVGNMQEQDIDYCNFQEMSALVVTWNAGATTPSNLRHEDRDNDFFREILQAGDLPDLLVFGFQELVDLEDKKLTAKSLFKGNKKKDPSEQEHVGRQYRAWRDYLVRCIEDSMPSNEPYSLLHTASLVGLFSCVFVRTDLRTRISCQSAGEVKRGMGGLHGNKGCLILRFLIDDSSVCLVNCHLAAGQTQTVHRNNDVSAILESTVLPAERNPNAVCDSYSGGGDGSMILDHDICILNGDLNYRIDTMGRDTVVKAIQAGNFNKLLERDQLLVSRRRNPLFRLRTFTELPITFAPTYKYDVGTDRYDTSEKHRAPAWCDRILYHGPGKLKQLNYRRHELRVSDHRPVSATFKMRIKSVVPERRPQAWQACLRRFEGVRARLEQNAKIVYLRDVLGVDVEEAKTLV